MMDASSIAALFLAALGTGGLGSLGVEWLKNIRAARREDASLAARVVKSAEHEREATAQRINDYVSCEKRCAHLEGENAGLKVRVGELEERVAELSKHIEALSAELERARSMIDHALGIEPGVSSVVELKKGTGNG